MGYPRFRSFGTEFSSLSFTTLLLIFRFPLVMGLISLTMIFSSAVFANKKHIAPKLSLVDVAGLNKVRDIRE